MCALVVNSNWFILHNFSPVMIIITRHMYTLPSDLKPDKASAVCCGNQTVYEQSYGAFIWQPSTNTSVALRIINITYIYNSIK